jgi:hypothetical protein
MSKLYAHEKLKININKLQWNYLEKNDMNPRDVIENAVGNYLENC